MGGVEGEEGEGIGIIFFKGVEVIVLLLLLMGGGSVMGSQSSGGLELEAL